MPIEIQKQQGTWFRWGHVTLTILLLLGVGYLTMQVLALKKKQKFKTISVEALELRDPSGKLRGVFYQNEKGSFLDLYGPDGDAQQVSLMAMNRINKISMDSPELDGAILLGHDWRDENNISSLIRVRESEELLVLLGAKNTAGEQSAIISAIAGESSEQSFSAGVKKSDQEQSYVLLGDGNSNTLFLNVDEDGPELLAMDKDGNPISLEKLAAEGP